MKFLIMLGFVVIYKCLNIECYNYLVVFIIRVQLVLRNILLIGSDGDSKIFNGMNEQFFVFIWLLCKKYVEDNLRCKLMSFGIIFSNQ